jgi:hypothetical protein
MPVDPEDAVVGGSELTIIGEADGEPGIIVGRVVKFRNDLLARQSYPACTNTSIALNDVRAGGVRIGGRGEGACVKLSPPVQIGLGAEGHRVDVLGTGDESRGRGHQGQPHQQQLHHDCGRPRPTPTDLRATPSHSKEEALRFFLDSSSSPRKDFLNSCLNHPRRYLLSPLRSHYAIEVLRLCSTPCRRLLLFPIMKFSSNHQRSNPIETSKDLLRLLPLAHYPCNSNIITIGITRSMIL